MRTVVAALISRDSRLLVCQRKQNDSHPLQWEFPGGKVEPGELPEAALARELREELDIAAIIGPEVYRTRHRYKNSTDELLLIFYEARIEASVALKNLVFERFEWADIASLPAYDFLEADKELIQLIASGTIRLN